jgi:hypothetical protein
MNSVVAFSLMHVLLQLVRTWICIAEFLPDSEICFYEFLVLNKKFILRTWFSWLINDNLKPDIILCWLNLELEFFRVLVPEVGLKIKACPGCTNTYLIAFWSFFPFGEWMFRQYSEAWMCGRWKNVFFTRLETCRCMYIWKFSHCFLLVMHRLRWNFYLCF